MLIARQPIFDNQQKVFGYGLLYREVGQDGYICDDHTMASSRVIAESLTSAEIGQYIGDTKAFIHFTYDLLNQDVYRLFDKEKLVVEMPNPGIEPTPEFIVACTKLNGDGYTLAFGSYVLDDAFSILHDMIDIVKIDVLSHSKDKVIKMLKPFQKSKIKFLALKVEDNTIFKEAKNIGFVLFQGYFFSKPEVIPVATIKSNQGNLMRLIKAGSDPNVDFDEIASIINMDVGLSFEILKLANSPHYYRGNKISSVYDALVTIGLDEIRRWIILTNLRRMTDDKNAEALNYSIVRSKFMELLANALKLGKRKYTFSTCGLLSMIDVLTSNEMSVTLGKLHLDEEIYEALTDDRSNGQMADALRIVKSTERGQWQEVLSLAKKYELALPTIADMHHEGIKWSLEFKESVANG